MSGVLESVATRIAEARGLDALASTARDEAHDAFVAPAAVDRLLGGDWLGHPVHPVAAQIPLGAWLMAVLLDLSGRERHAAAVDTLLLTGCVAALPTAVTGVHDFATTTGPQTRVAFTHAATMDVALGLVATAWVKHRRGNRRSARRWLLAGVGVAGAGGWLGGHLAYRMGVGQR